jgi:hypothetical protein
MNKMTLGYIKVMIRWPKVQDMVAWGFEHNDPMPPRVPRCNNLIIISYVGPNAKTLGYPKVKV